MFKTEEEKQKIIQKWDNVFIKRCDICKGTKYNNQEVCGCFKKAQLCVSKEISDIPITAFEYNEEHLKLIKYDFNNYFNNIKTAVYRIQNLYLYNLPHNLNNEVIGYITDNLINQENTITGNKITVYYTLFENLIQLSLRSNVDKEARNKLNAIIYKPTILFIDNLGYETGFQSTTGHNVKLLQLILKERSNRVKSTVISSNMSIKDIETFYSKEVVDFITTFTLIQRNIK